MEGSLARRDWMSLLRFIQSYDNVASGIIDDAQALQLGCLPHVEGEVPASEARVAGDGEDPEDPAVSA